MEKKTLLYYFQKMALMLKKNELVTKEKINKEMNE